MTLGSGPMSAKRWRPDEQVGSGTGIVAGVLVLPVPYRIFALVQHLIVLGGFRTSAIKNGRWIAHRG